MTKDEFTKELTEIFEKDGVANGFMHEDWDEDLFPDTAVEMVDDYGGEDCGSDYYTVFKFSKDGEDLYVKFQGWYASHYGSEYQEYRFVTPKKVTVVRYV